MRRVACSLLVFLSFLCYVQCQWSNVLESESDFHTANLKRSRTSNQGWSPHHEDHPIQSHHTIASVFKVENQPTLHVSNSHTSHKGRTRRQLFGPQSKNSNAVEDPYSWSHTFTMEWNSLTYTKDSAYIYNENTKRLKHLLEKNTEFIFLNPSCLRISIPADSINLRIEEFRVKVNDEFRGNNDGQIVHIMERVGGRWNYYIPRIRVKQGDKVYYKAKVKFNKEGLDATVKGMLEITMGIPHVGGPPTDSMPLCSAVVTLLTPQTEPNSAGFSSRPGDGQGPYAWNHMFNLNATGGYTKDSAKSWLHYADFLKNLLEKNVEFTFLSPTGLMLSIPDNNVNLRIVDLRAKINQEFWENDSGHFLPNMDKRDGRWRYYIPNLKIVQGDRVFYRMRVKLGKEGLDAVVNGVLEITMGNPHVNTIPQLPTRPLEVQSYNPHISQVVDSYTPVEGSPEGGKVGQAFSWDHKFISINVNSTKGGLPKEAADRWLEAEDNIFKEKDIDFQFLNPTGLIILIAGNNKEVLEFNVRLNEEFKNLVTGQYWANVTRTNDGRYSYFYPSLKLKNGDKLYYWMRVVVGKEMWDYNVKGKLEISKGNPHSGSSLLGTISTPALWLNAQPSRVDNTYSPGDDGLHNTKERSPLFEWEHRFSIDSPVNGGFTQQSVEDARRLKYTLEKDVDFQFINPTGLKILISGEDKGFRILAFNIKVNENFENLEPGDYVANITRMRNGRWSHYYPNVKVKQGDRVYYWMRVTFGKDLSDCIVRGELEITRGNPHISGPVAEVAPPNIVTQTQAPQIQTPVSQENYQPTNISPQTQPIGQQINYQPPNQPLPTEPPVLPNIKPPSQALPAQSPVSQNSNPPPLTQPSVSNPTVQTGPCVSSETNPNGESNPQCVKIVTHVNPEDGHRTHEVTIGGEHPVHIHVQVGGEKSSYDNSSNKS